MENLPTPSSVRRKKVEASNIYKKRENNSSREKKETMENNFIGEVRNSNSYERVTRKNQRPVQPCLVSF